jgi:hypothetical protein
LCIQSGKSKASISVEQIKDALHKTINNVTRTAASLGVTRKTIHDYINRYPELQEHRSEVIEMLCDEARSNVYEDVMYHKNVRTSIRMLENSDPVWRNKQTIEHTGTVGVVPGMMSKDEILKLSDAELDKMDRALSSMPPPSSDEKRSE